MWVVCHQDSVYKCSWLYIIIFFLGWGRGKEQEEDVGILKINNAVDKGF